MLQGHRSLRAVAAREQCHHADLLAMFCPKKHLSAQDATGCVASLWQTLVVTRTKWWATAPSS